ncbi:MAG: TRAP transporter small permease subunit [Thermodesulfobacteriota bacterium]|nr:TRAP transporter small permease subunit [Thermodesulfobacteriota bacterium]
MQKFFFYVDKLSEQSGKLFAWIIVILTLSIVYEVAARYLFNAPTIWAWDLSYMLYGAHFMMGAAYTLHLKANVRIDVFYRYLSPKRQALVDMCLYPVFFFPALIVLLVVGVQHLVYAWEIGERTSMTMWRVSLVPFKAVLPLASLLLILQGIVEFIRTMQIVTGREE